MSDKHTQGPWQAGYNPRGEFSNEIVVRPAGQFPHGTWIADCGALGDPEREANARLIAAAPDLLAACRKCMEQYAAHGDFTQAEYEMILAAIAKAEGRS